MQIITNARQREIKQHGSEAFPFLLSEERMSGYDSGAFMWHWHPEIELTWVRRGAMIYRVNQYEYLLRAGDVLFCNANAMHSGQMHQQEDCDYMSVTVAPRLIYGVAGSAVYQKYAEPLLQDFSRPAMHMDSSEPWHHRLVSLVKEIAEIAHGQPFCYELDITIRLQKIWKIILEHWEYTPVAHVGTADYQRVREIISFIEAHYHQKLSLKAIADHIHLCPSECCRMFSKSMKVTLFAFIQEYRVERSLAYLMEHKLPISEISALVGFSDSNYYAKVFARIKGCSPVKYRQSARIAGRKEG